MKNKKSPVQTHVNSVGRALYLLDLLADNGRELSLTELAKAAGWPKSTVHGLVATLRDYGYIDQSPETGRYRLGVRLFELGSAVAQGWDIREMALPAMRALNECVGEMVQLATEDKGEVLYIEKLDSTHMLRIVSQIGARLPMHCSGLGKVLLAHKRPSEVKWILSTKGMPSLTARTITDREVLEQELAKIRKQGYAIDDREIMEGLCCVAAPIYGRDGSVRYAISVSGLSASMCGGHMKTIISELLGAAKSISYAMGYRVENLGK